MSNSSVVQPRTSHSRDDGAAQKNGKSFMRKSLGALTVAGLALGGSLLGATAAHAADIDVSDVQFLAEINHSLDPTRAPNAAVTEIEAQSLTVLKIRDSASVSSLDGLEHFVNLERFEDLGGFTGSSVAPLAGLTQLWEIYTQNPSITEIPALSTRALTHVSVIGTGISSITNIVEAADTSMSSMQINNTPITSIADLASIDSIFTLQFGGFTVEAGTTVYTERSEISDITPIASQENVFLAFLNTSVEDISPLAGKTELQYLAADRNFISDVSSIPASATLWSVKDQEIVLPEVTVGDTVVNPLRDANGQAVAINPADAPEGFVDNEDGTWSFTSAGENISIPFEWQGPEPSMEWPGLDNVFSGTVTINVTEGAIVGGDVDISGTPGIGKELTANASGFKPADADVAYEWIVDGEVVGTGPTFIPGAEHAGKDVSVNATISKPGYSSETVVSAPVTVATPSVVVSPSPAKPGDSVSMKGENFAPGEEVTVTLQPGGIKVTVTTDENGSFTAEVKIPADAQDGEYTATAAATESGATAVGKFTVSAEKPAAPAEKVPGKDSTTLAQTGAFSSPVFLVAAGALALLGAGLITARAVARQRA